MKRFFKTVVFLAVIAGWPLALGAIHVVRTPGQVPVVGSMLPAEWGTVHVFTKEQMSFRQTFADTRHWGLEDVAAHPQLVARMTALGLSDSIASVGTPQEIDDALKGNIKTKAAPVSVPPPPPAIEPAGRPVQMVKPVPAGPSTQPTAEHKPTSIFDF